MAKIIVRDKDQIFLRIPKGRNIQFIDRIEDVVFIKLKKGRK